jgi:nitrite reductase (NO-forming)
VERAAEAPLRSTTRRHRIRLETIHVRHTIAPGVVYDAWTFGGQVPGPALRATVGDTIDFTIVNKALMPHSMDFHAAEIAPDRAYVNVMPNDSLHFRFVPRVAGAFMYHCGTAPVAAHIANGMYGALIVDPARPRPAAREFVVVQSEFYLGPKHGPDSVQSLDWQRMLDLAPDYVVFNGSANLYATHPLEVRVNEPVRFYVVNAGPNRVSSFHVVGAIFDRVWLDGSDNPLQGVQTFEVPVGGGMIFDTHLVEKGIYPFVSHAFADATKGAVGMLKAGGR